MRRAWGAVALGLVVVLSVGGCSGGGSPAASPAGSGSASGAPAGSSSAATTPAEPVEVAFTPARGTSKVRPDQQVRVDARNAALTSVEVRSSGGVVVPGDLTEDGASWRSSGVLATGTTYTVSARTRAGDGTTGSFTSGFSTLRPTSTTSVVLIPGDGWEVGVGMPVIVQFGRSVRNKEAAVRTLTVQTSPKQLEGAWRWVNDQSVWWRPRDYWPSGTTVKVTAAIEGAELSPGTWGRRTYTSSFTIGSSVINTVDLGKHTLTVTKDGSYTRTIPVTGGKNDPRFRTRGGIKVVMEKLPSVRMNASTTGTDPKDPDFYDTVEYWAMRLTWSGEYLHARPGSDWAFGKQNISHGCTGMSWSDAKWLFDFSKIGDVVVYLGSSRGLEFGNGYTLWNMTFDDWASGA